MWGSAVTVFIERNVICFWLYTTRLFFVSSTKLVNKQKEKTKSICDSVNHTRFPKEDHLPDWVCRVKHGNKGDRVHPLHLSRWEIVWRNAPRIWRDFGSALPFQTRFTQIKPVLPLSNEHGSQAKDQGRRQCCHNTHKKCPYRPTRDVS
jgi:hypothetical protein